MYSHYWNLDSQPFENTLDPAFFFPSQTHQSALLKLRYMLENRKGAGVLVGPTGSGKTFLVHRLADGLVPHSGPDYARIVRRSKLVLDTVNHLADFHAENVVPL